MQNNKPPEESQKKAIICPVTMALIKAPCAVTTCMWNYEGRCGYKAEATELDLGEFKGLSLSKSMLETRKSKSNITKVLILDRYVTWVIEKYPEKAKVSKRLAKDEFVKEARQSSRLYPAAFNISLFVFCTLCRGSVFEAFLKEHPEVSRNKLPSIIGLRENTISKVRKNFKRVSRKSKSQSNQRGISNEQSASSHS